MKNQNDRLETVKELIATQPFGNQEELLQALKRKGFVVTQGTLSRDLKRLKATKTVTAQGRYVFVLPANDAYRRIRMSQSVGSVLTARGFESIHFSGNTAVIHTKAGCAASIACAIDDAHIPDILGTVAGWNTVIMVVKEGRTAVEITDALRAASAQMP